MDQDFIQMIIKLNYNILVNDVNMLRQGGSSSYVLNNKTNRYLLKMIPKNFEQTFRHSIDVIIYLNQFNFSAPKIVVTINNTYFVECVLQEKPYLAVIFEYIEGSPLEDDMRWEELGVLVGTLHRLMDSYEGYLVHHNRYFFIDRYMNILKQKEYHSRGIEDYETLGNHLWHKVKSLPMSFCHGDLYKGNIILGSNGAHHIIDFDTSCIAFPMHDIALICNETNYFDLQEKDFDKTCNNFRRFLKGYFEVRNLSTKEIESFFDMIAIYHYQLQATIIEINGLDCIDNQFIDKQWQWLQQWERLCRNFLIKESLNDYINY